MDASFRSGGGSYSESDVDSKDLSEREEERQTTSPTKKVPKMGGLERLEMIVRDSMKNARPKTEDEKYGDDGQISYHLFKNNFKSAVKEDLISASDVINEAVNWTKGRPKKIVKTCLGHKNPDIVLKVMWKDLNLFYGLKTISIEERAKAFSKNNEIDKDDMDVHIDLITDLIGLKLEAEGDNMGEQLDRPDIIRDIIKARIPYIQDSFFEKETKIAIGTEGFKFKFDDLVEPIFRRATVL